MLGFKNDPYIYPKPTTRHKTMAVPWHSDPPAVCSTSASPPFVALPLQGASISCCTATSCSHLPWLIVASTPLPPASPSPVLRCHASFFLCHFCPLSAPDDCHIAASCCIITSCQLGPDVCWRQQQHCVVITVTLSSLVEGQLSPSKALSFW